MMQWIRLLVWLLAAISALPAVGGEFENLGIPVTTAGVRAFATGPGPDGRRTMLYISYNQYGAPFFLMQIDPDTGIARQFNAPRGSSDGANLGSWACYGASDGKMYLGTYNGGNLLSFDPKHPENGIRLIGRPSSTESYIWEVTEGPDGKIYGCTYPQAKLVSYDPATDKMADLGRLDPVEMYSRRITTGKNGWIYIAIGPVKAQIVAYNTSTKEKRSLIPEAQRPEGFASVYYNAIDGHAYGSAGGISYRLLNGAMTQVSASSIPSMPHAGDRPLEDGRWFVSAGTTGTYTIRNPAAGTSYTGSFTYEGAGSMVFVVGDGPDGCVYGSSILPLNMFAYDPVRRTSTNLGNPTDSGGELYSFATIDNYLYMSSYPGSVMAKYDPTRPFAPGYSMLDNPFKQKGNLGEGHLRPRAMIVGPRQKLFVGSFPEYGKLGGAMGVVEPLTLRLVENYHNIVPDQAISALAYDPESGLVFGGSNIAGGGGSVPTQSVARFYAWDDTTKQKVVDIVPIAGETAIASMCVAFGRVFVMGRTTQKMMVFDIAARKVIHTATVTQGRPVEIALGLWHDSSIYGLAGNSIIAVNPFSFAIREVARSPVTVSSGWAINPTGIYYGSNVNLWRYRWSGSAAGNDWMLYGE